MQTAAGGSTVLALFFSESNSSWRGFGDRKSIFNYTLAADSPYIFVDGDSSDMRTFPAMQLPEADSSDMHASKISYVFLERKKVCGLWFARSSCPLGTPLALAVLSCTDLPHLVYNGARDKMSSGFLGYARISNPPLQRSQTE